MTQTAFWPEDLCIANHHSNPSSNAAFEAVAPHLGNLQLRVLAYVATRNTGATVKSVIKACKLSHQTASARLSELKAAGWVELNGVRRDRCSVVVITDAGRAELSENGREYTGQNYPQEE